MKKFVCIASTAISLSVLAQKTDCTTLKNELATTKIENAELSKQNLYYKQTLDLLKPLVSAQADNVKFDIIKAVGSKKDKTLKVYYIYTITSKEARHDFQANQSYIVDPQGNQSSTFDVFASETSVRVENIQPDIPMKGVLKFKIEQADFPMIKLLNLKLSNLDSLKDGLSSTVIFRDIPVSWAD